MDQEGRSFCLLGVGTGAWQGENHPEHAHLSCAVNLTWRSGRVSEHSDSSVSFSDLDAHFTLRLSSPETPTPLAWTQVAVSPLRQAMSIQLPIRVRTAEQNSG